MTAASTTSLDRLVQHSRRALWFALVFIVVLGAAGLLLVALPGSEAAEVAKRLFMLLPLFIIIALAALKRGARGANTDPSSTAMQAILGDELRQASLSRSYRNGFLATLLLQVLLAPVLTWTTVAYPVAFMTGATALVGASVFLASLLYYDR